jgi:site-specific DNA-methyltransferase (adenine-specific)
VTVSYIVGDTRDVVRTLPDASVDLIITSPPFLALRSYLPDDHPDKAKELGSEPNPAAFIDMLLALTAEWRRVLAPHGTLAVELGDTYAGNGTSAKLPGADHASSAKYDSSSGRRAPGGQPYADTFKGGGPGGSGWPLAKSLALIPELYRVALAYGINPLTGQPSPAGRWRVRNNVTWCRPNPPVGSLGDKFRPSTSDLVIACTSDKRWFDLDAVRTPHGENATTYDRRSRAIDKGDQGMNGTRTADNHPAGAPPLDHWVIPPGGYTGSHYAVFPPALLDKPIEACCPRRVCRTCGTPSRRLTESEPGAGVGHQGQNGGGQTLGGHPDGHPSQMGVRQATTIGWTSCDCPGTDGIRIDGYHTGTGWRPGLVLDPFGGSGTTGVVASGRSRDCILVDLDDRNADLARERLGMFLEVTHHDQEPAA